MEAPAPASLWATDGPALSLPFHVWVRGTQRIWVVQFIASGMIILLLAGATLWGWVEYGRLLSIATLAFYASVIITDTFLMPLLFRSHIAITEQGISLSQAGFNRRIVWQD